ncbi:MAG TPA: MFS transporter [Dehalococcoidia bacterium]|nr:MFS transporter [Dehalococcoidia bacterium]
MGPPEGNDLPPPAPDPPARRTSSTTPETPARVGIPSPGPSFRGALASRDFSLLWIGQFGSEAGNGLVQLALPFLVLEITGSAFQLAGAYVVQFLPWLLFGLIGGVLVDRWDRRMTIVVVEVVRAAAFLSVGLAFALDAGVLSVEIIYALIFLESSLQNFFNPARLALMPNLVKEDDLRAANSLMEVSRHIGFLVAPPAGLVLADFLGSSTIILADGVTFLISGITVFLIKWRQPRRELVQVDGWREQLRQVLRETKEGIAVIRAVRLLQVTLLLGFSLNLVVAPIQTLLPLFVIDIKEQTKAYFGLLGAAFIVGLIVGSLVAPAVSRRVGLGRMTITSIMVLGLTIAVAAYLPTLWVPIIALLIAGTAIGSLNVAQINMLQTSTTDEERGRVSAAYYSATLGVRTLGYFSAGALVAPAGVQPLFVAFGVVVLFVGLFIWRIPEVRDHH